MKRTLILILTPLLLHSCISNEEGLTKVGLLNGPSSIIMVNAMDELTYLKGEKVHYVIKDNPQHLRALLQSGNIDMAILPMTMAYQMLENELKIKIFAITGWGNLYLVSHDSAASFENLQNQSISIPGEGQTPDLVSKFLIEYLGLQNKVNINYTYPSPLLLTSALAVGKVENAILPEPLASVAIHKDSTLFRSVDLAASWSQSFPEIPLVQSVFVVRTSFYENQKKWFHQYTTALEASADQVIKHPNEAVQLAIKKELLPSTGIDSTIIDKCQLDFVKTGLSNKITPYINTFYQVDTDFNIRQALITE